MIGNDIVDLRFPDSPSFQHVGHLERVCTAEEQRVVRNADSPSVILAALWAAKEAAYKSVSRKIDCRFVPRWFVVHLEHPSALPATATSHVTYAGITTKVEFSVTEQWVHAVAISPGVRVVRWSVREIERRRSETCPARAESLAVRALAAELISKYCPRDVSLEFIGEAPRTIVNSRGDAPIEVSFAHHGRFVAVAMAQSTEHRRQTASDSQFRGIAWLREETCFTCTD